MCVCVCMYVWGPWAIVIPRIEQIVPQWSVQHLLWTVGTIALESKVQQCNVFLSIFAPNGFIE